MSRDSFLAGVMNDRGMTPGQRALITETLSKAGSPTALLELQRELSSAEGLRTGGRFGSEVANVLRLALAGIEAEGAGDTNAWTSTHAGPQGLQDSGRIDIGEGAEPSDPSYRKAKDWIAAAEKKLADRRADDAERVAEKMRARQQNELERQQRDQVPGLVIPDGVQE